MCLRIGVDIKQIHFFPIYSVFKSGENIFLTNKSFRSEIDESNYSYPSDTIDLLFLDTLFHEYNSVKQFYIYN